jgi:ATP-dependent exoDNAse (exonuclease V) beta subunit
MNKLNKFSLTNYSEVKEFLEQILDNNETEFLHNFIQLVFKKASNEPTFCPLYAKLVSELSAKYGFFKKELYDIYITENIELHSCKPIEWQYFINFVKDHPHLKPYRTEWTVWHEDVKISGSIDMIYENPDGTLSIYDWKRAKLITRINNFNKFALPPQICHLPDSNFWHYALQLNTYKAIIEQKYGKKVTDLFLVRLHPDAEEKNYELIKLPDLSIEISDLFLERRKQLLL